MDSHLHHKLIMYRGSINSGRVYCRGFRPPIYRRCSSPSVNELREKKREENED